MNTRTAIVTGAARGIGSAVATRLADDGFAVAVLDLNDAEAAPVARGIEAAGGRALAVAADVSDETAVEAAVERVARELGPPTVLVNNAGIIRDNLLFKMSLADWELVMSVHLRGAFLMTRATQKYMTDVNWGRIVNLSSTSALGQAGQANYAAAKAGVQGFTKTLAIELGRLGITVNAIAPGFIETEMTAATAARIGIPFEDFKRGAPSRLRCGVRACRTTSAMPSRSSSATLRDSSPDKSCTSPVDHEGEEARLRLDDQQERGINKLHDDDPRERQGSPPVSPPHKRPVVPHRPSRVSHPTRWTIF